MAKYRMWRALVDCEAKITGFGHVLGAKRGELCPIPPELETQARQYMEPFDSDVPEAQVVVEDVSVSALPLEREAAIEQALEAIAARNDPKEFTANTGLPKVGVVREQSGLDTVSHDEVKLAWSKVQQRAIDGE